MMEYFRKKLKSNKGDGVLVFMIFGTLFLFLVCALSVDIAKNVYIKQNYDSEAQNATTSAVKTINSDGSLNSVSVSKFLSEYLRQTGRSGVETSTSENNTFRMKCTNVELDGSSYKAPYMRITLGTDRKAGTSGVVYVSEGGGTPTITSGTLDPSQVYKVISADIYDVSDNMMMSWFGVPCQYYHTQISSISFGSNEDTP